MDVEAPLPEAPEEQSEYFPEPIKSKWPAVIISVLVTALAAGGGVFAYENNQQAKVKQQLQTQINSLTIQLAQQPSKTTTTAAVASPVHSATPSTGVVTPCQSGSLQLGLADNGGGTAGTFYYTITVTNLSSSPCTITGFPKAALLNKNQVQVGDNAINASTVSSKTLTVNSGSVVYASVGFPDSGNFSAGVCSAVAANLSITPPDNINPLLVALSRPYCPGFSVSAFSSTKP